MRDTGAQIPPPDPALVDRFARALHDQHRRLRCWSADDRIGLAVSGGPDSLALLLLAHAACPGRIEAATVDHGLRPESAGEAQAVARLCARLGVAHATLKGVWNDAAGEGLQAAARAYRYRELTGWCGKRGLRLLLTAHHADDQAETLLMRLARGAGIGGLGSIRPVRPIGKNRLPALAGEPDRTDMWPVDLLRPLLRFTKAELVRLVGDAGLTPAEDRSNDDERFDRTRARRLLAANGWLDPARLAASASHLADAHLALGWAAREEGSRRIRHEEGEPDTSFDAWTLDHAGLPDELLRRIVVMLWYEVEDHALAGYVGPDPAGPKVVRLIARLRAGQPATLGHVIVRPGALWRFTVAPPRRS